MADLKRFFKKTVSEERNKQTASVSVPEGLWIKCPKCGEMVYREDVISNTYVCPKCGGYFRISAKRRIKMIVDKGSFKEWFTGIDNSNPLDYPDYPQKIENLKEKTKMDEAILIGVISFVTAYLFSSFSMVTMPSLPITSPSGIFVSNIREWIIIALEDALVNQPLFRISSGSQAPRKYHLPSHQISTHA